MADDGDVSRWRGQALATWDLAREYGFMDVDGRQPHGGEFFKEMQVRSAPPVE